MGKGIDDLNSKTVDVQSTCDKKVELDIYIYIYFYSLYTCLFWISRVDSSSECIVFRFFPCGSKFLAEIGAPFFPR